MPQGLARYGLNRNPYFNNSALDPLLSPDDREMLVEVDGFERITNVNEHIKNAIKNKKTPFFMITGKSGTGRSSLSNYILRQYCEAVRIHPENLIIPHREYRGYDKIYTIKKWFGYLRAALNDKKIPLNKEIKEDFQTYLADTVEATLEPNFLDIANRISAELAIAPHNRGFACCLEDVEDFTIIDAALNIFSGVPTICVFTVQDYSDQQRGIIAPFREKCKKLTGSDILELTQLSSSEARELVASVWTKCSELENPFDLDCIEKVFRGKHRSIGLTLTVMAKLIDHKLAHHPDGNAWPDATELAFTCDQLRGLVPLLEERV